MQIDDIILKGQEVSDLSELSGGLALYAAVKTIPAAIILILVFTVNVAVVDL